MKFDLKNFQILKIKKYFKSNKFFFIFHSSKSNLKNWTKTEQTLKNLKLDYYKLLNGTSNKTLKNSIFKNYIGLINSLSVAIKPIFKTTILDLTTIKKILNNKFLLISIKLNNKIYSPTQVKNIKVLSYKQNMFQMYQLLDKSLKQSYILTNKKIKSK